MPDTAPINGKAEAMVKSVKKLTQTSSMGSHSRFARALLQYRNILSCMQRWTFTITPDTGHPPSAPHQTLSSLLIKAASGYALTFPNHLRRVYNALSCHYPSPRSHSIICTTIVTCHPHVMSSSRHVTSFACCSLSKNRFLPPQNPPHPTPVPPKTCSTQNPLASCTPCCIQQHINRDNNTGLDYNASMQALMNISCNLHGSIVLITTAKTPFVKVSGFCEYHVGLLF